MENHKLTVIHEARLARLHQKSRQSAKKRGQRVPDRNEEGNTGFAIPIIVPVPSSPDPAVTGDLYASNPQCGSFTPGGVGNCVAGTCGGAVGAGACAGGACAGGAWGGSGVTLDGGGGGDGGADCGGGCGCGG